MKALAARRRHPLATVVLLLLGLAFTGAAYAAVAPQKADASTTSTGDVQKGHELFLANCATCHGMQATGTRAAPSLVGVGAAAVDFQVGTGRMPMQQTGPQALQKPAELNDQDIRDLSAYVASLGPGPAIPSPDMVQPKTDARALANGQELFRVNCAMCHNVVGAGGALTRGKFAPSLHGVSGEHIYEAMVTGPQSMPVFNDANITPQDKQDIISYLSYVDEQPSPGGLALGSLGPVAEGFFIWAVGVVLLIACAVWLGAKSS
ncbi:MAG: c-type cytochrome [Actinomycetes bacterium]